jgi:hypothetical protein
MTRDAGGALDLDPDLADPPQALDGGVTFSDKWRGFRGAMWRR